MARVPDCPAIVAVFKLDVATIGSQFGSGPRSLPWPRTPNINLTTIGAVLPDATTIALLAGIESLLSAVVADGMTGRRHRSNCELVAQGIANCASAFFGGLPATGAIARTATNIRAGARTPIAGMLHAACLLIFIGVAAPILSYVPLAALAAILAFVAWNIAEFRSVRVIMTSAPAGDRAVLVTTFVLTVAINLTAAIEVGVVMAAILFMHRMANAVSIEAEATVIERDTSDTALREGAVFDGAAGADSHTVIYRINGPFFFGATEQFAAVLDRLGQLPRSYILDLGRVPFVDSTAASILKAFVSRAEAHGVDVFLVSATPGVRRALKEFDIKPPAVRFAPSVDSARAAADKAVPSVAAVGQNGRDGPSAADDGISGASPAGQRRPAPDTG
jgi:SulP family sulfate permease